MKKIYQVIYKNLIIYKKVQKNLHRLYGNEACSNKTAAL